MGTPNASDELVLDLRDDLQQVREFVRQTARHCAASVPGDPVLGIEVFFGLMHGFVKVGLYSRPDYKPFYCYSGRRHHSEVRFLRWADFFDRWFKVPSRTIFPDGSVLRTVPGHNPILEMATAEGGLGVVEAVGVALKRILNELAVEGVFDSLGARPVLAVTDESSFWWSSDGVNPGICPII